MLEGLGDLIDVRGQRAGVGEHLRARVGASDGHDVDGRGRFLGAGCCQGHQRAIPSSNCQTASPKVELSERATAPGSARRVDRDPPY